MSGPVTKCAPCNPRQIFITPHQLDLCHVMSPPNNVCACMVLRRWGLARSPEQQDADQQRSAHTKPAHLVQSHRESKALTLLLCTTGWTPHSCARRRQRRTPWKDVPHLDEAFIRQNMKDLMALQIIGPPGQPHPQNEGFGALRTARQFLYRRRLPLPLTS